jgi:catechol 2,3-dioxygenase-like lactoylglutathione lyase family enzyme
VEGSSRVILGIHHVQVTIPTGKEAEARRFYCEVLGLTEIVKPAALQARGGLWLRIGDRELHIGTEQDVDRAMTKAHIAYEVTNLPYWRATLSARGITVVDGIPIPGCDRFEFRDPFGNRVEFIERRPAGQC